MTDRDSRLSADFIIQAGEIVFDVQNGDGSNCEGLASIFTEDDGDQEITRKPEYSKKHSVGAGRRTI